MINLRFINPLVLLVVLTLPCFGCVRSIDCKFIPQSTSDDPIIPDGFGVNIDFTDPRPGEVKMLSEAGIRWVRMDFVWEATEKEPGRYDFSAYDRLMTALEPYGIHALFILDYGNRLYDNSAPPRTEATRQAFARWAVAAAKHFAGRGTLWEIYNEPNQTTFWPPKPNPQEYVALALAVGRAFREAVPDEKLIGPATSEIDFDFLESCFKAGLLEYWSAVSIHPYRRGDPETAAQDYCRLREMIRTYAPIRTGSSSDRVSSAVQSPTSNVQRPDSTGSGSDRPLVRTGSGSDRVSSEVQSPTSNVQRPVRTGSGSDRVPATTKDIPIISSEWGYSSIWLGMSEEKQGQLLARGWLTNVANSISLSIWYDWRDDGLEPSEPEHHFGTVSNSYHDGRDPVYDPKPAYLAAKTLTAFFNGYRFEKRLDAGGADDYVLVFRKAGSPAGQPRWGAKGGELRFAAWTTANAAHSFLLPLNAGSYTTTRHTGQSVSVVSADQKGLRITLTTAPVYIR